MSQPSRKENPSFSEYGAFDTSPSEASLQPALNAALAGSLRIISLAVGLLFTIITATQLLFQPRAIAAILATASGVTSLAALAFAAYLSRSTLPARLAHPAAAVIGGVTLINFLAHLYLDTSPALTTNLVILILCLGFLLLSTPWLILLIVIADLGWAMIAWVSPASTDWLYFGSTLFAASAASLVVHSVRLKTMRRLQRLQQQELRTRQEMQSVLVATEHAQRSLATSMAVGQRITSILELDDLLGQMAELIQSRFGYYAVNIFLLDKTRQFVVLRGGADKSGLAPVPLGTQLKVGEQGIVGWVAAHRRPARVDDVNLDPRYIPVEFLPLTRSELSLPLEMGREILGVLDMQSDRLADFSEDDLAFMQTLADQVAIAIHNASTYQVEKSRRQLAENLYDIGRALSGTLDLAEELDLILKYLTDIVPNDRASLLMREGDELSVAASRGFPTKADAMRIAIQRNDFFQEIYRTQKPLAIADIPAERPDWQNAEGLLSARSWLGIPLIHSDAVMGMLSLVRETLNPYTSDEIALASTFAGQAALALRNAQLYDQIQRFNQDLENLVAQRTEELQTTLDKMQNLDRAKSDFIGIASHELRTPLTVIQGYSQMLREEPPILANEQYQRLITGIQNGARRLYEIVDSMLDVAKIDNRELRLYPSPVPVASLTHFVVENLREALIERRITITEELHNLPSIEVDVDGMRKVFYHLIVNAIKFTPDGGSICISGRSFAAGEGVPYSLPTKGVEIIIADSGIGIDPAMQELIFVKFFQAGRLALHSSGKTKFKGGGPGLGLAIAKGIIEAHNGRIWVESPGHDEQTYPGSQFHVLLPLSQSAVSR